MGNGVVAGVVLPKTKSHNSGWIVITLGWGIAVAVAAFISGKLSPAHLNPAVTIGVALNGGLCLGICEFLISSLNLLEPWWGKSLSGYSSNRIT